MAKTHADNRRTHRSRLLGSLATALGLTGCVSDYGAALLGAGDCEPIRVIAEDNTALEIAGIEDLTVDMVDPDPLIILSATERREWMKLKGTACVGEAVPPADTDGVFVVRFSEIQRALAADSEGTIVVRRLTTTSDKTHPHGVGLIPAAGGAKARLFVVDHVGKCDDRRITYVTKIRIGDLDYQSGSATWESEPIPVKGPQQDPDRFCSANDIAPLDRNRFFISHDSGHCSDFLDGLDLLLDRAAQELVFYDGAAFRAVADGFGYVNGVMISPVGSDGNSPRRLYTSDTRRTQLKVFKVDDLIASAGDAQPDEKFNLKRGLDNLEWGDDGMIYSGAHPDLVRFAFYGELAPSLVETSPTAIVQIDPTAPRKLRLMAYDDGRRFSAASATLRVQNLLISGAVFDKGLFVCDASKAQLASVGTAE